MFCKHSLQSASALANQSSRSQARAEGLPPLNHSTRVRPRRNGHASPRCLGARLGERPDTRRVFQTLPGSNFTIDGAIPAKNSALTSAGVELRLANGVTLLGKFDGDFASHSSTYAGTGAIRYRW